MLGNLDKMLLSAQAPTQLPGSGGSRTRDAANVRAQNSILREGNDRVIAGAAGEPAGGASTYLDSIFLTPPSTRDDEQT